MHKLIFSGKTQFLICLNHIYLSLIGYDHRNPLIYKREQNNRQRPTITSTATATATVAPENLSLLKLRDKWPMALITQHKIIV